MRTRDPSIAAAALVAAVTVLVSACGEGGKDGSCEEPVIRTPTLAITKTADGIAGDLTVTVLREDGSPVEGIPLSIAFFGEDDDLHGYTIDNVVTGTGGGITVDFGQSFKLSLYVEREYQNYNAYRVRVRPLGPVDGVPYCFGSATGEVVHR